MDTPRHVYWSLCLFVWLIDNTWWLPWCSLVCPDSAQCGHGEQ